MARPRQKIYVAVGKDLLESLSALKWVLHNRPAGSLILLHLQRPIRTIPSPVGKIPVNRVSKHMVNAHKKDENRKLNDCMEFYVEICSQAKVKAEPLIVEKADVCRGIVEVVSELGITKLIMATSSASGAKFKKSKMQRPGKAGYVLRHAINSCEISIICKGKLVVVREGSVVNSEDFGPSFSLQPNFQGDLATSMETPRNFPFGRGFTRSVWRDSTPVWPDEVNESRFEASLDTLAAIDELSSDTQVAESRQIDSDENQHNVQAEPQVMEALEVAENAKREVQRETVRCKNAEESAMKPLIKLMNIEDAILVSKMKEECCQELTRRLKEVEEELQALVDKGTSLAAKVKLLSHERHQVVQELQASEQNLAAVEQQNHLILKQKEAEIKQLQDLLHSRSRVETPYYSNNLEFSEYSMEDIKAATGNFSDHFKFGGEDYGCSENCRGEQFAGVPT